MASLSFLDSLYQWRRGGGFPHNNFLPLPHPNTHTHIDKLDIGAFLVAFKIYSKNITLLPANIGHFHSLPQSLKSGQSDWQHL